MFHPQGPTVWELLVQALSSTEQGYDLLAPKFDSTPFRTPEAILGPAMAQLGGPRSVATALDLCCGTGAALRHLRPLCRDRVVGIDLSQGMLAVARRKTQEAPGEAPIDLLRGHVLAMPFRAAFDLVVCFGAFGHILPGSRTSSSPKSRMCSGLGAGSCVSPPHGHRGGRRGIGAPGGSMPSCTCGMGSGRPLLLCTI